MDREFAALPPQLQDRRRGIYEIQRRRAQSEGNPEVLWSVDVPGVDPLSASEGDVDPQGVSLSGDTLAVVYELKAGPHDYRVTAFSFANGRRLWDVVIEGDNPFAGVATTPTHVFVSTWGHLYAFDAKTGTLAFHVK